MPEVLYHLVIITFKENTCTEDKNQVFEMYQGLDVRCGGKKAGICFFKVEKNLDKRKGDGLVELMIFEDNILLQKFRTHNEHKIITDFLSKIADWKVGDFISESII